MYFVSNPPADLGDTMFVTLSGVEEYDDKKGKIITFEPLTDNTRFVQTETLTRHGVAVHPYGAYIVPNTALDAALPVEISINYLGTDYKFTGELALKPIPALGTTITLTKVV